ncbi:PucR family transcriptional regulator [Anoxynatronum buryatiense]|uniref:PucR C-terminal helix-turn-helix domain-containing protein n=1 Tax=Anoxynatronum buryatiense TaxID=489973 RepID=A0AA45WYA4_9CLOT|nr:helix-turn-helix domain-containing protein [Anoxynatronum buryatiense]SMP68068.1 PucR C-terminal helix-turn-helix domain-containing protein [Anoxynatronum buryatiense]
MSEEHTNPLDNQNNFSTEDEHLSYYSIKLLDSLAERKGLQHIVDLGYEMLGNPFHVVDLSWKRLAYTKNCIADDDRLWQEFDATGYLSVKSVTHYLSVSFTQKLINSPTPFFWDDGYTKYGRLMSRISIGNKAIAAIGVLDKNRPFKESDIKIASIISDALSAEMQKNKFIHFTKGLLYEDFIKDLLDKKIANSNVMEERKNYLHLNLKKHIYVLTADVSEFDSTRISLSFIQGMLERIIGESKSIIYNDHIVIVVSYNQEKDFRKCYEEKTKELLKDNKIRIGISRPFTNLEHIHPFYLQSLEALFLGVRMKSDNIYIPYDDYAIYHILKTCSKQDDLLEFCNPSLLALIRYDLEYDTDYTKSLYVYTISSKSITSSANTLKMHRNTMIYRIRKIAEIMKMDLSDYETFLHIQLSFMVLKYDNKYVHLFT